MIKGVIYDLDGTIIDTVSLHEAAWQAAAQSVGVTLSQEMLVKQKGVTNEEAVRFLFPEQTEEERTGLIQKKNQYIITHPAGVAEVAEIEDAVNKLRAEGYKVWICTSAPKEAVLQLASNIPVVSILQDSTVWREMYKQGKPAAEPLLVTLKEMNLQPDEVLFVGDARSDYQSSKAANISFLYFIPDLNRADTEIPLDIPRLTRHEEIFNYLDK